MKREPAYMPKINAVDVAQWFVERANKEVIDDGGVAEGVTNLKLQKLLYFAQAVSLSLRKESLFEDEIVAWKFGPVVPAVYSALKEYGNKPVSEVRDGDASKIDEEVAALLEDVWGVYGKFSAYELVNITHAHRPWKDAFYKDEPNQVITEQSMREYYANHFTVV